MKRVKLIMTSAVIMLAVGGAFASKNAGYLVYTTLEDMPPGQTAECQVRGTCSGNGALCYMVLSGAAYQLYRTNCTFTANGIFGQ